MRCNHCNVEITCKATECPLCHSPLLSDGEQAFPSPQIKILRRFKLNLAYIVIALLTNIACITANLLTDYSFLWCVMVAVCFMYVYYFLNFTLFVQKGFHKRILGQTIMLTAIFGIIKIFIGGNYWIYITWLPIVYFVSEIVMLVCVVLKGKEAPKFIATFLLLCLLGTIIPVSCAYGFDLSVKWPCITASSISAAFLIVMPLVYRKTILHELHKVFHL